MVTKNFSRANQLLRNNRLEEAVIAYKNAIERNPTFPWLYHNLGETFEKLGRLEEAIQCYQDAISRGQKMPWSLYKVGKLLSRQNRKSEASKFLKQAVALKSDVAQFQIALGDVLQELGEQEEAILAYKRALEKTNSSALETKLANLLQDSESKTNKNDEEVNQEKSYRNKDIDPWRFYHDLAEKFRGQGKLEKAIECYYYTIDVNPSYFKSYHDLGELLQEKGNFEEALELYRRALELKPDFQPSLKKIEQIQTKLSEVKNTLHILDTHKGDVSGLGILARHISSLGTIISDARETKGKVLVPGRPDYYSSLVSQENTNYLLTMFESDRIPSDWVKSINYNFSEVFVPHNFIKKAFQESGVTCPVSVLPLAYPERKRVKPIEKNKKENKLKLGCLCGPTKRKNTEKLVEAVKELIQEGQKIELFLHCTWLKQEQKQWYKLPFIKLTEGKVSDSFINQWYSELDAYICPSSGEGWSLTPRESMSLGIPTIVSNIGVHQELLESGFYIPIRSDGWQSAYYEFLGSNCGNWKSYSIQNIKSSIMDLIENYEYWYKVAQTGKEWLKSQYKWSFVEKQLLAQIYPKHILFRISENNDNIDKYCQNLIRLMPKTKHVTSYFHLEKILQNEDIQSIHVHYDPSFIDTHELLNYSQSWECIKKIYIHSSIMNIEIKDMLKWFDDIYVFTYRQMKEMEKIVDSQTLKKMKIADKIGEVPENLSSHRNLISMHSLANTLLSQGRLYEASFYYGKLETLQGI